MRKKQRTEGSIRYAAFLRRVGERIATGEERPRNDRLEEMRCKPGRRGEGTPPYGGLQGARKNGRGRTPPLRRVQEVR